MNITQLVERLTNLAETLPHGAQTEVHMTMCDGDALSESTNYVTATQVLVDINQEDALLVGHPHMHTCPEPCDSFSRVNVVLLD